MLVGTDPRRTARSMPGRPEELGGALLVPPCVCVAAYRCPTALAKVMAVVSALTPGAWAAICGRSATIATLADSTFWPFLLVLSALHWRTYPGSSSEYQYA